MVRYPVTLTPDDNGTLLVGFPDFPEAHTFGEDREEALTRAVDALETIIDAYIHDRQNIPEPSEVTGESVTLPTLVATKVLLYRRMRQQRVNKTELAKRLRVHLPQVDRLLDIRHGSKLEQLEAAAAALDSQLDVVLVVPETRPPRLMAAMRDTSAQGHTARSTATRVSRKVAGGRRH